MHLRRSAIFHTLIRSAKVHEIILDACDCLFESPWHADDRFDIRFLAYLLLETVFRHFLLSGIFFCKIKTRYHLLKKKFLGSLQESSFDKRETGIFLLKKTITFAGQFFYAKEDTQIFMSYYLNDLMSY